MAEEVSHDGRAPLSEWRTVLVGDLQLVTCPVCACLLNHRDTQALAAHVLWHHQRGEWEWEQRRPT